MTSVYQGKVRNVYDIGNNILLLEATDRTSGFNRHLCNIQNKGVLLNKMSEFWFNKTQHIIPNHLLYSNNRYSVVKKCSPFKIEVIVRGYITGSTETSLWTHYKNGSRNYCGIMFPDGLIKDQKLETPVITPTTKDENDRPITPEEIVKDKYMTQEEMDYVFKKALELYNYGAEYAESKDLLLVDTKYEFGKDMEGNIILIDEVHTCDSSRYWKKNTYHERFQQGKSPEKYDKDQIRDWVKTQCDPYNDAIPEIPQEVINLVYNSYNAFYEKLVNEELVVDNITKEELVELYYKNSHKPKGKAFILYGSEKDQKHIDNIVSHLKQNNIDYETKLASAHKNTETVLKVLNDNKDERLVWITVAGRSNALSGVVAANSKQPCIACPPFKDNIDMMVNINSTLQMPSNVPVLTVLDTNNLVLSVKRILDL